MTMPQSTARRVLPGDVQLVQSDQYELMAKFRALLGVFAGGAQEAWVSTVTQPTIDVLEALSSFGTFAVSTAALASGTRVLATVPAGERWKVTSVDAARTSGDRTISALFLNDGSNLAVVLRQTAANVVTLLFPAGVTMEPGQTIEATVTGGATDSIFDVTVWRAQYDSF